jgi:regulatory protein
MLAGREYLQSQLAEKLAKKFDNSAYIPEVLERLVEENLQSDHRFIEAFIRSRISRGQGETRIRLELKQRGANLALVSQLLAEAEIDWYELAFQTATNKFGQSKPVDAKEKAKRMRFLQYRGYNFDQINYALKQ